MRRSQVPLVARSQTVETDAPSAQTDGETGGSGPQSVGSHAASAFSELLPAAVVVAEPEPAVVGTGLLAPHAITNASAIATK